MRLSAADRAQLGIVGDSFPDDSVLRALAAAGATREQAALLWSIGYAESGYMTGAENVNSDGSIDRGPWQINSKAWPDISAAQAHRLDSAAAGAMRIFRSQGATAWVAYDRDRAAILSRASRAPFPPDANAGARVPPKPPTPGAVPPPLTLPPLSTDNGIVLVIPAPAGQEDYYTEAEMQINREWSKSRGIQTTVNQGTGEVWTPGSPAVIYSSERHPNPTAADIWRKVPIVGGAVASVGEAVGSVVDPLAGIAGTLTDLAAKITNIEFWRKAGIVILAGLVGLTGVVLVVKG